MTNTLRIAILDRLRTVKPFVLGIPTATKLTGYGFSESDRAMQAAFVELVAAGQVVEKPVTDRVSQYSLVTSEIFRDTMNSIETGLHEHSDQ